MACTGRTCALSLVEQRQVVDRQRPLIDRLGLGDRIGSHPSRFYWTVEHYAHGHGSESRDPYMGGHLSGGQNLLSKRARLCACHSRGGRAHTRGVGGLDDGSG